MKVGSSCRTIDGSTLTKFNGIDMTTLGINLFNAVNLLSDELILNKYQYIKNIIISEEITTITDDNINDELYGTFIWIGKRKLMNYLILKMVYQLLFLIH